MGYQNDTPASVVFQALQQLRHEHGGEIPAEMEECEEWKDAVLLRSQYLLLQMASPDALVWLKDTTLASSAEELRKVYFIEQHHGSMRKFLSHHLKNVTNVDQGTLIQVCDSRFFVYSCMLCFVLTTISNVLFTLLQILIPMKGLILTLQPPSTVFYLAFMLY